jgi:cell wall-associated NlpC family hydrolase
MFLAIAWSHLGRFYKWGGDDPSGFDCSGLVVECSQSVGLMAHGSDSNAAGLWLRWQHLHVPTPRPGDVIFFGKDGKVSHVEICVLMNPALSVGASGGWSETETEEDAINHNAYVKVRPIYNRGLNHQVIGIVDLFKEEE